MMLLTMRTLLLKPSAKMAASGVVRNVDAGVALTIVLLIRRNPTLLWGTAL